ncbi:MAG: ABC transporter ATP-binding protein [Opitutales bacterium]
MVRTLALGVTLRGRRVLDGVSFEARPGETLAVIGANGAGKTTLLRALCGLVAPSVGAVVAEAPGGVGYCPQHPRCAWDFTVREICRLSQHPSAAEGWCESLGGGSLLERRILTVSGGERRVVHLALALAAPAEPFGSLVLLDEPTAGLDAVRRGRVGDAVRRLASAGATVVTATHDLALAESSDRVLALSEGRMNALGPPDAVLSDDVVRETWGAGPSRLRR